MIEPPLLPTTSSSSSSSSSSKGGGKSKSLLSSEQRQSPEMARTTERKKSISMKKRGGVHLNKSNSHQNSHSNSSKTTGSPQHSGSGGGGTSSTSNVSLLAWRGPGKSNLPPRPPPPPPPQQPVWIDPLERSGGVEQQQPPSHLQCGSSEDLSFADFSAMEDSLDDCYTTSVNDSYHSHNHNSNNNYSNDYHHHNNTFLDGSSPGQSSNSSNSNSNGCNHSRRLSSHNTRKVSAIDVASVGNASDTMVVQDSRHANPSSEHHHPYSHNDASHHSNNHHSQQMMLVATRDLHERAKLAFNAEQYHEALPLFESILSAQVQRFSSTIHPSVGAAMHNVGVRWLGMMLFLGLYVLYSRTLHF